MLFEIIEPSVSGQFLDYAQSQRHSVRSTRRKANFCPFLVFLVDYFFTFSTLATASGVQDASCRLSPRPRRSLRGNATPTPPQALPCSHAQIDRGRLCAFVTAVVLDHFTQCRERSHLTFRKVVVYRLSPVPAVKEKAVLEVVEVAQRLFHWAFLNFTCACAMQIRWSTPSLPSRKLYAV